MSLFDDDDAFELEPPTIAVAPQPSSRPPPAAQPKPGPDRPAWPVVAAIIERAIAEERHPRMDAMADVGMPLHVCSGCREFKVIYFEIGVGGGVGVAGRVELCRECGEARGMK